MLNNFTKLTEDVHSQIKFADEANACFDDVLKKLKEIVKNKRIKNSDGVYYSNVYGGGNGLSDKGDAIILTNRKHDTVNMYNDKYLNLSGLNNNDLPYTDILITNCRLTKAGVFMMRQDYIEQNQIVLYCLQNNPQSEVEAITSLTAILSSPAKLKDMRSTFVHEYMHLCEHNMRYIKNKDFEFEDQDLPWSERQHEIDAVLLQYIIF